MQFEDIFDKNLYAEPLEEIKKFGRLVIGQSLSELLWFSKRFNVSITFFEENEKVYEVNEAEFYSPVQVAVYKRGAETFVVYRVDEKRMVEYGRVPRVNQAVFEVFEELGLSVVKVMKENPDEEKGAVFGRLQEMNEKLDYKWKFLSYS